MKHLKVICRSRLQMVADLVFKKINARGILMF